MKTGTVRLSDLDNKKRLTASSYLDLEDHELEVSALIVVKSKRLNGQQINEAERIKVKFKLNQVQEIARARGAKSVDEVREIVSDLIRGNMVAALTEATRKA
jgi:hypothetical protein